MATKKIFVNLPVKNLDKSKDFFARLGFTFNAQFTDETAACMVVSEDIYVMLLTQSKFKALRQREIWDTAKNTEVLVCLSAESRKEVDEIVRKASPREAKPLTIRKITVLCMGTHSRTSMAISGNWLIWSPARLSNPETVLERENSWRKKLPEAIPKLRNASPT